MGKFLTNNHLWHTNCMLYGNNAWLTRIMVMGYGRLRLHLLLLTLCLPCTGLGVEVDAPAPLYQTHNSIFQAASKFIHTQTAEHTNGRIEVTPGYLDNRLQLQRCKQPLTAFLPSHSDVLRTNTIGIRCDDQPGWSLYAPVKIQVMAPILVATRLLTRQHIIRNQDVRLVEMDINHQTKAYVEQAEQALGKQVTHDIPSGAAITQNYLTEPKIIKKGDEVAIIVSLGNLHVSMKGIALQDGILNQSLAVKNIKSGKVVQGIAKTPQQVEVTLQ